MLKVGITGGIGSGKSYVSRVFAEMGIPVYDSDFFAKELMENDTHVMGRVNELLGNKAFTEEGLDRKYIASRIYADNNLRQKINNIVHPAVGRHFKEWCGSVNARYIIKEAAILFESGADKGLGFIISVFSPVELRKQRVLSREGMTAEKFDAIVKSQMPDEERNSRSDFVLVNDERKPLLVEIIKLHEFFLSKCN